MFKSNHNVWWLRETQGDQSDCRFDWTTVGMWKRMCDMTLTELCSNSSRCFATVMLIPERAQAEFQTGDASFNSTVKENWVPFRPKLVLRGLTGRVHRPSHVCECALLRLLPTAGIARTREISRFVAKILLKMDVLFCMCTTSTICSARE